MSPALLVIVFLLAIVWIYKNYTPAPKNSPPGPLRLPFIGSYLQVLLADYQRSHVAFLKLSKKYDSPIINYSLGSFNIIVTNDLESSREALLNPYLQGRVPAYPALLRTFGDPNGLFGSDGDVWLSLRRKTLRALRDFGFGRRSEAFEGIVEDEVQNLVNRLNKTKGEAVKLPDAIVPTPFNLINHLLYGERLPEYKLENLQKLGREAQRFTENTDTTGRLLALWPWIRYLCPTFSGFTGITETTATFNSYAHDLSLSHAKDFDKHALRDLTDFYFKYKHDNVGWTDNQIITTDMDLTFPNLGIAVVISFALGFLAERPTTLEKCREEIDNIVGRGRLATLDDRSRLPTVEAVIKETLRFLPLVPLAVAHRATEDTTLGGYNVPKDSVIITNMFAMHTDPKVWEDPHVFWPERFLQSGFKDKSLPFGLGKRLCAGETYSRQNLFLILAAILQNFEYEIASPLDPKRYLYGFAISPNSDFAIKFLPRS